MHGHGPGFAPQSPQPPRRPGKGTLLTLRVVFVVLCIGSFGMLTWAAMLRVAVLTRKQRDWTVFFGSLALLIGAFVLIGTDNTEGLQTWRGNAGVATLLVLALVGAAYFLYVDIRRFETPLGYGPGTYPVPGGGALHPTVPSGPPTPGYGYPPPSAPRTPPAHTLPNWGAHAAQHPTQPAHPAVPRTPGYPAPPQPPAPAPQHHPTPPPQHRTAPARIDQVRAELDELSDFLRNGNPDPAPVRPPDTPDEHDRTDRRNGGNHW
ncbi:hypothetical protein ACFWIA_00675 [Streptomyces sp. NPDC127068]|uniref:hypothetical protein n=1 Tax=Streptomyces sp. NPDC127068 TaxID=3347127 RepID=UPI0036677C9C